MATTAQTSSTPFTPAPFQRFQTPSLVRRPVETLGNPASTSIPLSFVRRLAADASLRSELEAAPAETLARHGVHIAPDAVPAQVSLPSQQELESVISGYATDEDRSMILRFGGFLDC